MSRPAERRAAPDAGFTLVEVLVAFAVMATILGVLYRGVVQTRAGAIAFDHRTQEEVIARSLLTEYQSRRDLTDGSYAGNRDGRRWTLRASSMDLTPQLPKGMKPDVEKPGSERPTWVAQRLVLQVATGGRPLEAEAVHLVRLQKERAR